MINFLNKIFALLIGFSFLISCAVDKTESDKSVQDRILQAYLDLNYPGVTPTEPGFYIIDREEGSGAKYVDTSFFFIRYSTKSLSGTYINTTYEDISKMLGTYSNSNYYGEHIWVIGEKRFNPALEEMIKMTRVGGRTTAIIPPMSYDSKTGLPVAATGEEVKIYDIAVKDIVDDIEEYQIDKLENYSNQYYGGMDSVKYGLYFKKIEAHEEDDDTIAANAVVNVRYIGRFLDGKVFDTNIADTAKKYRIFKSSSTYKAMDYTYYEDPSEAAEQNSTVKGFSNMISRMNYGEKAIGFFWYDLGYGTSGNMTGNSGIPAYHSLFFEIWIDEE